MLNNRKTPDQEERRQSQERGLPGAPVNSDQSNHVEAEQTRPKLATLISTEDLDKMVAESLKDIGSDEELSGDDDDPDLLGELQEITGESDVNKASEAERGPEDEGSAQLFLPTTTINVINIIKERIKMYEAAEQYAKTAGEEGRVRRFDRGLKTLHDFLKQANAGKTVNVDDIPPEVSVKHGNQSADGATTPPEQVHSPTRPAPAIPVTKNNKGSS